MSDTERSVPHYCRHCGSRCVAMPTGWFDTSTGQLEIAPQCDNRACVIGAQNIMAACQARKTHHEPLSVFSRQPCKVCGFLNMLG